MDQIYSVSEITHKIKSLLEFEIPDFYLEGEISEIKYHSSGHVYFSLKDSDAVMPAVMWRSQAQQLTNRPQAGARVVCHGSLSVYPPQGRYQFVARSMKPSGIGELFLEFEEMKKRLSAEGLFDDEFKKAIPAYPRRIAIIAGDKTAALQDMLRVFRSSHAPALLILAPARVQGGGSAEQIVARLDQLHQLMPAPDCILIARGGGSLEDLWEFNKETLARRIFTSTIPVISGVGHETDFSICDFVADFRASTPTAAAELCVRAWNDAPERINYLETRALNAADNRLSRAELQLNRLLSAHGLRRLPDLLERRQEKLLSLSRSLTQTVRYHLEQQAASLKTLGAKLELLNPANVLSRGYSVTRNENGEIIRSVGNIRPGSIINSEVADGILTSEIRAVKEK